MNGACLKLGYLSSHTVLDFLQYFRHHHATGRFMLIMKWHKEIIPKLNPFFNDACWKV
eukprot:m.166536 g.166536  ORF g.166536 m.166536 type:complete len:58 (-) comp15281_c0_seq3:3162-3335(-)